MIRRPPRSTRVRSSAASDVYKRQVLERVGGLWTIVDDGLSRNGTFLNGRRPPHRARLRDRDKIRIGETVLTFCAPPQTTSPPTVAGGMRPAVTRLTDAQRSVLVALCRPY